MQRKRKTLFVSLILTAITAGGGWFAYQKYEAFRQQEVAKALAQDCDRCTERKAAGLRFRQWLATQREQESANSSQ